jgi:hypothetical protein
MPESYHTITTTTTTTSRMHNLGLQLQMFPNTQPAAGNKKNEKWNTQWGFPFTLYWLPEILLPNGMRRHGIASFSPTPSGTPLRRPEPRCTSHS